MVVAEVGIINGATAEVLLVINYVKLGGWMLGGRRMSGATIICLSSGFPVISYEVGQLTDDLSIVSASPMSYNAKLLFLLGHTASMSTLTCKISGNLAPPPQQLSTTAL